MTKFKGTYRIESTRLQCWDYSNGAYYYVTICTKNKSKYFGKVVEDQVILSEYGLIAKEELLKTETIRKNVRIDEFIVMPNHIHAILILENTNDSKTNPVTLGNIIGQFKGKVTKRLKDNGVIDFEWQSRFYEHIIRNEKSYLKIKEYIMLNPLKWHLDEYY